ncbi:hypothetical protein [uncultured Pluralibacter sp.]|uniref:hypothetical protein n=1 Tax=uncultured Pluralibacter sp. TaxID=1490864 RepID=UPI00261C8441|nr:hypothetical protein [uncultured Pluralibacter sp.]
MFYISQIDNGAEKKQLHVIALDSKDVDAINLKDIGCIDSCNIDVNSVDFIGRLNGKYRIAMHLGNSSSSVSGFYYYEKNQRKINLTGYRNGLRLTLKASVPEGVETFDGLLEKGQFKGIWKNAAGDKTYPFILYTKII